MGLNCLYKGSRLYKTFVRACVKPCKALTEKFNIQGVRFKINSVKVCDLQLASTGGL